MSSIREELLKEELLLCGTKGRLAIVKTAAMSDHNYAKIQHTNQTSADLYL